MKNQLTWQEYFTHYWPWQIVLVFLVISIPFFLVGYFIPDECRLYGKCGTLAERGSLLAFALGLALIGTSGILTVTEYYTTRRAIKKYDKDFDP